jgi:hypothetical protein
VIGYHVILRGHRCSIILDSVYSMDSPCEDKSVDIKDIFCEELGHVFDHFVG